MKRKTSDDLKGIIGLIFMVLILMSILFLWFKITIGFNKDYVVATIGLIGSVFGGIVGGVYTLRGVRLTLNQQNKQLVIDSYPKKRRMGDSISDEIKFLVKEYTKKAEVWFEDKEISLKNFAHVISYYFGVRDKIINDASEISGTAYYFVKELNNNIENFKDMVFAYNSDEIGGDVNVEKSLENLRNWLIELVKIYDGFDNEMKRLNEEYERLLKSSF